MMRDKLSITSYCHSSSIKGNTRNEKLEQQFCTRTNSNKNLVPLTLIWAESDECSPSMFAKQTTIFGEIGIVKYLARLFNWGYDTCLNEKQVALIDQIIQQGEQQSNKNNKWLAGDQMSIADLIQWGKVKQQQQQQASQSSWLKSMDELEFCRKAISLMKL